MLKLDQISVLPLLLGGLLALACLLALGRAQGQGPLAAPSAEASPAASPAPNPVTDDVTMRNTSDAPVAVVLSPRVSAGSSKAVCRMLGVTAENLTTGDHTRPLALGAPAHVDRLGPGETGRYAASVAVRAPTSAALPARAAGGSADAGCQVKYSWSFAPTGA